MNPRIRVLMLVLLAASGAAHAQSSHPVFRQGWYLAPMATYMKADKARCTDDGAGGALALGHRGEIAGLEIWGQYVGLPYDCSYVVPAPTQTDPNATATVNETGTAKLVGGGIGVQFGPYGDIPVVRNLYGVIGFGALRRQSHPKYGDDETNTFGDAGVGYFYPFAMFARSFALRAEARYRYDAQTPPHPNGTPTAYADWIFNAGLLIPLSAEPQPPPEPRPEPVAVVPAAETDADHDGVPDGKDQCPDTPAGERVDESGCKPRPVTIEQARAGDTIVLEGVNFETASARLTVNAQTILDDVATQLNARPDLRVEIGGHTDDRGSDAYNQSLSQRRAQSVLDYLAAHGVDAARLSAQGYGESRPAVPNDTDENRERNRRVELKVLDNPAAAAAPPADTAAPTDAAAPADAATPAPDATPAPQ